MKISWLAALFPLVSGCVYYKAPLCPESMLADPPNFEGSYLIKSVNTDFNVEALRVDFIRLGKGRYKTSEPNGEFFVCQVDGRFFSESWDSKRESYSLGGIERRGDGGFNMIFYAIDVQTLDKYKIPYEIKDSPSDGFWLLENPVPMKTLIVDNRNVEPLLILQLLDELAFRIAFQRTTASPQFQAKRSKTN